MLGPCIPFQGTQRQQVPQCWRDMPNTAAIDGGRYQKVVEAGAQQAKSQRLLPPRLESASRMMLFFFQALEDDRQAMRVESITEAVGDEIDFACSLLDSVWKRIPGFCGCRPRVIRSDVIEGCLVAEGSFNCRVFRRLRGLPWSLERGNIAEDVRNLREECEPADPVSSNIWKIARVGYNEKQLEDGEAPQASNRFERDVLLSHSAHRPGAVAPRPWWLSKVCNNRQPMRGCIFKVASAGREDLVLFVFAMKQPLVAYFRALQPSPRELLQPGVALGSRRWPLTLGHIRTHTFASLAFSLMSLSSNATPRLAHCFGRGALGGFQGGLRWRVDAIGRFP